MSTNNAVDLVQTIADSSTRRLKLRSEVVGRLADPCTLTRLRRVVKPPSAARTLRTAGTVLLLAPEPLTAIPGTAMLGAAYLAKRREPAGVAELTRETRRVFEGLRAILPSLSNSS